MSAGINTNAAVLFVFARLSVCQYSMAEDNPVAQRRTAVTTYLKSQQLLVFAFL